MYPYYQQPIMNQMNQYTPQQNTLKGRPVSSLEEARVANIDFDGSLFIFPDVGNKKIYTKQINLDGTAAMKIYNLVDDAPPAPAYVTKEEFDSAIKNLENTFNQLQEVKRDVNESTNSKTTGKPVITF